MVGTSGYSYADWVGPVYPEGTRKGDYLDHYAALFSAVELNFTYYRLPEAGLIEHLRRRTPEGFRFAVKGYRSFTHERDASWKRDLETFSDGIKPLTESSRLLAVLLQFPFSFHYTPESRSYLARLCDSLSGLPLVLEFRNAEWQRDSVFAEMRKRDLGYTVTDYPSLRGLPEAVPVATSELGYVRFHGRNTKTWWTGDNASRYDYLYSPDELDAWVPRIEAIAAAASTVAVMFNNHWRGQAVANAKDLRDLLRSRTALSVS